MSYGNAKLGLFEKLQLSSLGKADAKKGMFQDCATGKSIYHNSNSSRNDVHCEDCTYSFWITELGRFDVKRAAIIEKGVCVLQTQNAAANVEKTHKKKQMMRFSDAITYIDKQMAIFLAQISLAEEKKKSAKAEWDRQESNPDDLAEHIKQLHINLLTKSCKEYDEIISRSQEQVVRCLSEKIRLIESIHARIAIQCDLSVLRIRYYYEKARTELPELPAIASTPDEIISKKVESVLGYYDQILSQTRKELKQWQKCVDSPAEQSVLSAKNNSQPVIVEPVEYERCDQIDE